VIADPAILRPLNRWSPVIALAVLSVVLAFGGDSVREWARYERGALQDGELWRLVTAHIVHLGPVHMVLNVAALLLLGWLFAPVLALRDWIIAIVLSAIGISVGIYVLDPTVDWYVGLSGVLHGVLACGALVLVRSGSWFGVALAVVLVAKLVWERVAGPLPFSDHDGPVIIAAHLYGAIAGAIAGLPRLRAPGAGP
jgi:rhomboid family GlyGly-CTERM serine protease